MREYLKIQKTDDLIYLERTLTPVLLCWYSSIGDIESLNDLIQLGVDLNEADYDGRTAIHLAAANNENKLLAHILNWRDIKL
jgi:glutaminase